MRDDIPTLLRDAAADPSHTPDFDALAARGRRQHLAARAGTAVVAVMALVAGGIVLWPDGQPARAPVIGDQPTTPGQDEEPAAVPAGWHEIQVGDATFGVPDDWTVESFREPVDVCPNQAEEPTAFVLHAGPGRGANPCLAVAQRVLAVQAAPLATIPSDYLEPEQDRTWTNITTSGGVEGQRLVRNDHGTVVAYRFPTLDLWLQFSDSDPLTTQADAILATVTAATEDRIAGSESGCPAGQPDSIIEWASFVQVGQRMMVQTSRTSSISRDQLGPQVLQVRCRIADKAGTDYEAQSGDAAFLDPGTPVYAIAGIDPGFRVVADDKGELIMFQTMTAPDAKTVDDVFDIQGRVTTIDVTRTHVVDGTTATGEITAPERIEQFVGELLNAQLASERQPSTNEITYRVTLHLREGPPLELLLYPADNLLGHPWITVPQTLTEQIEQAAHKPQASSW